MARNVSTCTKRAGDIEKKEVELEKKNRNAIANESDMTISAQAYGEASGPLAAVDSDHLLRAEDARGEEEEELEKERQE